MLISWYFKYLAQCLTDSSKCGDKVGEKQAHEAQNLDDKAHKILNRWDIRFLHPKWVEFQTCLRQEGTQYLQITQGLRVKKTWKKL